MRKTCSDRETHPIYAGLNKPLSQLMTQFEINQQCLNSNLSELKQSKNSSQMQCKALQKRFRRLCRSEFEILKCILTCLILAHFMAVDRIGRQPLSIEGPMLIVILLKSHQNV